jgi:hypothetical protein
MFKRGPKSSSNQNQSNRNQSNEAQPNEAHSNQNHSNQNQPNQNHSRPSHPSDPATNSPYKKFLNRLTRNRPSSDPEFLTAPDDPNRFNTKRIGERSEAAFLHQAIQRCFAVSKPWGDSERYDFILDNRPQPNIQLSRIQVKCTASLRAGAYETRATYTYGNQHYVYTKRDIDFIAAHVVPLDLWYIIPVEVCTPQPMLRFYPHRTAKTMRLEEYREAWHLLDPPIVIHACADPNYPDIFVPESEDSIVIEGEYAKPAEPPLLEEGKRTDNGIIEGISGIETEKDIAPKQETTHDKEPALREETKNEETKTEEEFKKEEST